MKDLNMLNLEIPAERVLKPLWVQLLLVFCCLFVGLFCFAFFQEEGASLHCRGHNLLASVGSLRSRHLVPIG